MSKPWPKSTTTESEPAPRRRSDTKALFRLGDKLVEADDIEALRRESGTHRLPRESDAAPVAGAEPFAPVQKVDVLLWFDEIEEPVRARAEVSGARLRIRAPLSLLQVGSQLHYTLMATGTAATARVERVAIASEPGRLAPVLEVELLGGEAIDTTGAGELGATDPGTDLDAGVPTEPVAAVREALAAREAPPRSGRWFGILCAGVLGLAGGADAMRRWIEYEQEQRMEADRAQAAREFASREAAAAAASRAPILFRVVPDEGPALPPAPEPSLQRYELLPGSDAIAVVPRAAAPSAEASAAPAPAPVVTEKSAPDADREPRITVEDQRTTIVIPMRGSADGMRSYPLSTPGVILTLPKAFALIPPGNHAPERGLARRIALRKLGAGTQVKVLYRSMAVRSRIAYDPAVGVAITLQRTW